MNHMSATEFIAGRHELPDGGRRHELHAGLPTLLEAPDDAHGTVVLNLSRAFGLWLASAPDKQPRYACSDLGLQVEDSPDTIYFPALSFFFGGTLFSQSDLLIATEVPSVVVEVAGGNDRRQMMAERIRNYLSLGIAMVWVADPHKSELQVLQKSGPPRILAARQQFDASPALPGFTLSVADVFTQPDWWTNSTTPRPGN